MLIQNLSEGEHEPVPNPLDFIQKALTENGWPIKRDEKQQLLTGIQGKWCDYQFCFLWSGKAEAVIFAAPLDGLVVKPHRRKQVDELLVLVNNRLWLGHFDLSSANVEPTFRHTLLLGGTPGMAGRQLEDLVRTGLEECERFYPVFQYVIYGGDDCNQALTMACLDPVGEA